VVVPNHVVVPPDPGRTVVPSLTDLDAAALVGLG
jgi:hypothetical protein